jgi:hypothetical protein
MTLNAKHAAHLAQFRISSELLEAAGVSSVTNTECREILGVHGYSGHDLGGILFPCRDPLTGQRTGARVKLDNSIDHQKYLSEQGNRHLFFAPVPAEWLVDINIPVVFIEAEKSALSIRSLMQRIDSSIVPVAIGGCWGWKRQNGKRPLPDGGTESTTGASPDFGLITWPGRQVIVLFDSNVGINFEVQWAREALSKFLASLGAKVFHASVPTIAGINGPDDFIAISTDEEACDRMLAKVEAFLPSAEKNKEKKLSEATEIVSAVLDAGLDLFHAPDNTAYVKVEVDEHAEIWPLRSRRFKNHLAYLIYERRQRVTNANSVSDALSVLEAKALFEGEKIEVHVRVAEHDGAIWLDLANEKWQAVCITKDGWTIVDKPQIRFLRPHGLLSLPIPEHGGSVKDLRKFLNVSDDDFVLIVAFLVAALRPRGPYPVLVISSEQGSGKTTTSRMIRELVDPNFAPTRAEPKENRDLAISCRNGHVIALDNVSKLQDWLSDTLARISTGDAFATRTLYTDADETLFAACRPVVLNGITAIPQRADLLDRSVIVTCSTIPDHLRRPEDELWRAFRSAQPMILGALLDAAVKALAQVDQVTLNQLPRMADFAKWVAAAEAALPWRAGRFLEIYSGNRQDAIEQILDSDPVADLAKKLAPWRGTAAELLAELNKSVPESMVRRKDWYSKPKQVSDHLRRIAPPLRRIGIEAKWHRTNRARWISIIRCTDEGISASPSSPSSPQDSFQRVNGDADVTDVTQAGNGASPASHSMEKICDASDAGDAAPPLIHTDPENDEVSL